MVLKLEKILLFNIIFNMPPGFRFIFYIQFIISMIHNIIYIIKSLRKRRGCVPMERAPSKRVSNHPEHLLRNRSFPTLSQIL